MIRILGIDCAVDDKKVGLAKGSLEGGQLVVDDACPGVKDEVVSKLREWIDPDVPTLLAIDAPLGWPALLGATLGSHQAGLSLRETKANELFRRYTDDFIGQFKRPLDVGADRIARTAHRALEILRLLAEGMGGEAIPLAWSIPLSAKVSAIEVYPAATLTTWRVGGERDSRIRKYKDSGDGAKVRAPLVKSLKNRLVFREDRHEAACQKYHDVLDAVLCLLAGADFLAGRAMKPPDERKEQVQKEGWIWCRDSCDLEGP